MRLLNRIISSILIFVLCLSVVSCRREENPQYETELQSTEMTARMTAAVTETTEIVTEPVTEIVISEIETEAITEMFPVLTGVSVDGAYQYHDLSEIIGQTSNPNIFKTNDSETPFLYFSTAKP